MACATLILLGFFAGGDSGTAAQTRITAPQQQFGFKIGADYQLANYKQITDYWRKLDAESDRMIGPGDRQDRRRTSAPDGDRHVAGKPPQPRDVSSEISQRLAFAEGLTDEQARALAKEGKAVVWIDGGLHATETLGAQQLDADRLRDGQPHRRRDDAVSGRHASSCSCTPTRTATTSSPTGTCATRFRRSDRSAGLPRLYHQYIGHDNNRDFFASTQAETENINRVLYHEWMPQILYNHHQSGPAGTVAGRHRSAIPTTTTSIPS